MTETATCERCKAPIEPSDHFCPGCGTRQQQMVESEGGLAHRSHEEWRVRIDVVSDGPPVDLTRVAADLKQWLGPTVTISASGSGAFAYAESEPDAVRAADAFRRALGDSDRVAISVSHWEPSRQEWRPQGTASPPRLGSVAPPQSSTGRSFSLEFYVDRPAAAFLSDFVSINAPQLAGQGYRLTSQSVSGATLSRRYLPLWAGVLGVLMLPLGLLGLVVLFFYRRLAVITLTFVEGDGGTHVLIAGDGTRQIQRYFRELADLYE